MSEVTRILGEIERGDSAAAEQLLPLVYQELRRLAAARLAGEKPGQTLQPTALVHEAYVRLVSPGPLQPWRGRDHFFAAAAEAMRRILVERARKAHRVKHGGRCQRVDLSPERLLADQPSSETLAVDEALRRFEAVDPQKALLVKLRYFGGFTLEESSELLGVSLATAKRHWVYARAWLFNALKDAELEEDSPNS